MKTFVSKVIGCIAILTVTASLLHAGLVIPVYIGDFVWNDVNGNGVQDLNEPGIQNVGLTLSGNDENGNTVTWTTKTDANGYYQFAPAPGTYMVTVDAANFESSGVLFGWKASPTLVGTDPKVDSNVNPSGTSPLVLLLPKVGDPTTKVSDLTVDFGFYNPVTIGNYVWLDANGNGIQDGTESGIAGVTLTLTGNTTADSLPVTDHATTDGSGNYLFTEAAGTYTVTVDAANFTGTGVLVGYTGTPALKGSDRAIDSNGSPSATSPSTLAAGGGDLTVDFGYYKPATIGNYVWNDLNGDGIQNDGASSGINGVKLLLLDGSGSQVLDGSGNPITATTANDGNGNPGYYQFTVPPGTYQVQVDTDNFTGTGVLAGYSPTVTGAGTTATDSNGNPSPTSPTTLASGGSDQTIDFGYYKPVTIGDFVWNDLNGNGVQDGSEPGIAGVTVQLLSGTTVVTTTTTDGTGYYQFSVAPGTYTVKIDNTQAALAGYSPTVTGAGTTATDSNGNPSPTSPTTLASGGSDQTIDFGYYKPVTIGDFVWNDLNGNGVQDGSEPGIPGVTLTLTGTDGAGNPVTDTATTDANGKYSFTEAPGTYTVAVAAPAGYTATITGKGTPATDSNPSPSGTTPETLASGGSDQTIDFGFYKLVTIGDFVWWDLNVNGVQDAGEPGISGVTVTLNGTDGAGNSVTATTTTDANGKYSFTEAPGTYTVTVSAPSGYTATFTGKGTAATDSNVSPSGTTPVILSSGGSDQTIDFGFYKALTITCPPDVTVPSDNTPGVPPTSGFSATQGGWGAPPNGNNIAMLLKNNFALVYPNSVNSDGFVEVGIPGSSGFSMKFTSAAAIQAYLPAGKTAAALTADVTDPTGNMGGAGVFGGQVLAMQLSVDFGTKGLGPNNSQGIGNLIFNDPTSPLNGMTLQQILDIANIALGGGNVSTYGVTIADLNTLVTAFNEGFDNGVITSWAQSHVIMPPQPVSGGTDPSITGTAAASGGVTPITITYSDSTITDSSGNTIITRTWTATDSVGQTATCGQMIIVGKSAMVSLGDFVWNDLNGNGLQDAGEPGIPGVTVTLTGIDSSNNSVTATTTTDANGHYLFTEPPGTYTVAVTTPAGYAPTATGKGTTATDSNVSPSGTTPTALASGGSDLTIDFGFYKPVTIGDFVWNDANANGVQDTGELGISGVSVTLTGTTGAGVSVSATATTDANGHYSFTEPPGTYTVAVSSPSGYTATLTGKGTPATDSNPSPSSTTLASGVSDLTIDFGFYKASTPGVPPTSGFSATQGGWGAPPNGNNVGALLTNNFKTVYPNGVEVGIPGAGGYSMKFTSAKAIENYLPAGKTAAALKADVVDPTGNAGGAGVFGGQVLAMQLNVDFGDKGVWPNGIGNLIFKDPTSPLNGMTLREILKRANTALGGGNPGSGVTIAYLNTLVTAINEGFDGGVITSWAKSHIIQPLASADLNNTVLRSFLANGTAGPAIDRIVISDQPVALASQTTSGAVGRQLVLNWHGNPGETMVVETSVDLVNWIARDATIQENTPGNYEARMPLPPEACGFFRLRTANAVSANKALK